jgi:hypothetical protein
MAGVFLLSLESNGVGDLSLLCGVVKVVRAGFPALAGRAAAERDLSPAGGGGQSPPVGSVAEAERAFALLGDLAVQGQRVDTGDGRPGRAWERR